MSWGGGRPPSGLEPQGAGSRTVRVVRTDETVLVLHDPVLANDSLVGTLASKNGMRLAIPASEVREVRVRRFDPLLTTGAILGGLLGSYVGVVTLILLTMPG